MLEREKGHRQKWNITETDTSWQTDRQAGTEEREQTEMDNAEMQQGDRSAREREAGKQAGNRLT
jgi:hypothetical protein